MGKSDQVWGYEAHDGLSCRFIMKFREVFQYPYSKSQVFWNEDPRRTVVSVTIRREVRQPNRVLIDFQQIESLFN